MQQIHRYDFKSTNGENIYFTSDLHYNHSAILNYCKRPFESVEEMNQKLIENWNKTVTKDDIVFDLGDMYFGKEEIGLELLGQLNGKHYLIIGNHCRINFKNDLLSKFFEDISYQMRIFIEDQEIWLTHFPLLCYPHSYGDWDNASWNLFGHVHTPYSGIDTDRLKYLFPTQYDVGVDNNNYTPVSFYKVKEIIENQKKLCGDYS